MNHIKSIQLIEGTNEELLPGYSPKFPYTAICAELSPVIDPAVPFHWHRSVELFYIEKGTLEYTTPGGKWVFPQGSGGFVNSNVLHSTRVLSEGRDVIQLLHQFDPYLLSGSAASLIDEKYIAPLSGSGIEMIAFSPDDPAHAEILRQIRDAFDIAPDEWGREIRLRQRICEIWLELLKLTSPAMPPANPEDDAKIKRMLTFIHEHFSEPLNIDQIAGAAHVSRRSCFRLFNDKLHTSPVDYLIHYRLQQACHLLAGPACPITEIAYRCGFASSSYFGKIFRANHGCSPSEFRANWHNRNNE